MLLEAFSVYDSKAAGFLTPFFLPNVGMAIREFSNCANDAGHAFCQNSADFTLYHIGTFDIDKGALKPLSIHVDLGKAASFIKE